MAKPADRQVALCPPLTALFSRTGYDGTALSAITDATGLGKGSLYHAFPGGKAEMGALVLEAERDWFDAHVIAPLSAPGNPPGRAIPAVLETLRAHVAGDRRPCLHALFAQTDAEGLFAARSKDFFEQWRAALYACLSRAGVKDRHAAALADETLAVLLGGQVLSRATGAQEAANQAIDRQGSRLLAAAGRPTAASR